MTEISRAALFGKLNPLAYRAIEGATVFCKLRGNPYVELVHWLHQILQTQDSAICTASCAISRSIPSQLAADITAALDRLPRGATSISDFSPHIEEAIERAWVFATLMFGEAQVRTGHLVLGVLQTTHAAQRALRHQPPVRAVKAEALGDDFAKLLAGSPEAALAATDGSPLAHARRGERRDGAGRDGQAGGAGANSRST